MSDNTKVDKAIEWFFNTIQEDATLTRVLRDFYSDGWLAGHTAGYSEGLEDSGASTTDKMRLEDVYLQECKEVANSLVATSPNLYDINDTERFLKKAFEIYDTDIVDGSGLDHIAEILYETASMVHTNPKAFDFSDDIPSDMEIKFGGLVEETSVDGHQSIRIYFSIRYITGAAEWVNYVLHGEVPSDFTKGIHWELFGELF